MQPVTQLMKAYVINIPTATERRRHVEGLFQRLGIEHIFVAAVVGAALAFPDPDYDEARYKLVHGKRTNSAEVGCYFSHIKALALFLESGDDFGLVCEDDITPVENFVTVLSEALEHSDEFDLLRLSGFHHGMPVRAIKLRSGYSLCHNLTRQTGAGAYLVNRRAAANMIRYLRPMWLPFDHAFDREWVWRGRAMCLDPMPVLQNQGFSSQINADRSYRLPAVIRYSTVFPFRFYNESTRILTRTSAIVRQKLRRVRRPHLRLAPG